MNERVVRYDHIPRAVAQRFDHVPSTRADALANDAIEAAVQAVLVAMSARKAGRIARRDAIAPADALKSLAGIRTACTDLMRMIATAEAELTAADAVAAATPATPETDPQAAMDAAREARRARARADALGDDDEAAMRERLAGDWRRPLTVTVGDDGAASMERMRDEQRAAARERATRGR